mgnify:CR=1 FL=1|tara:strand:+ start:7555 stop:7743 length:189 start_codon:yes stop_codon:yes gene_type:complete
MEKPKTSQEIYKESVLLIGSEGNLLEKVLADAKPVVPSTVGAEYDINARPTELSSGGYVDWC